MVHRARQGFVTARTACINRIRGLMSEFGVVPFNPFTLNPPSQDVLSEMPDRSDRQLVNSANPMGRQSRRTSGANGAQLSGSYLGPRKSPAQQGRL